MQSLSGIRSSLGCTECDTSFNSASQLLRHFAEHIIEKNNAGENSAFMQQETNGIYGDIFSKVDKEESILEKVLKNSNSCLQSAEPVASGSQETATFQDNTASLKKAKYNSALTNKVTSSNGLPKNVCLAKLGAKVPGKAMLLEITKDMKNKCSSLSNVMFVKLDLQKRLENCVLKLVKHESSFKDDQDEESGTDAKNGDSSLDSENGHPSSEVLNLQSDSDSFHVGELSIHSSNGDVNDGEFGPFESEEFNPLKFCMVTLEEGEEHLELSDTEAKDTKTNQVMAQKNSYFSYNNEALTNALVNARDKNGQKPVQKKYVCTYCCRRFGWSTDLKRHILTHTGERPFKCELCCATFTRNFLLQKHQFKIHSEHFVPHKKPSTIKINSGTNTEELTQMHSVFNVPEPHKKVSDIPNGVRREVNPKTYASVIKVHTESSDSEIGELEICDKKSSDTISEKITEQAKNDHSLKRKKISHNKKTKRALTDLHKQALSNGMLPHKSISCKSLYSK